MSNVTCDHCNKECTVYYPSGGDDLICRDCFYTYSRPQGEDESDEDYQTRHPYHTDDGYDNVKSYELCIASLKKRKEVSMTVKAATFLLCKALALEEKKKLEKTIQSCEELIQYLMIPTSSAPQTDSP